MEKSLASLKVKWEGLTYGLEDSTPLQKRIYTLYNTPLHKFSMDDVRFMIGQGVGVKQLLPIALSKLEHDILHDSCYYEGDLLSSVLTIPREYWVENIIDYSKVYAMLVSKKEIMDKLDLSVEVNRGLRKKIEQFLISLIS